MPTLEWSTRTKPVLFPATWRSLSDDCPLHETNTANYGPRCKTIPSSPPRTTSPKRYELPPFVSSNHLKNPCTASLCLPLTPFALPSYPLRFCDLSFPLCPWYLLRAMSILFGSISQQIQTISERLNQEFGPALFNDASQTASATTDHNVNVVESETMGIIDMMNRRMNSTTTTSAPMGGMRHHRPRRPMGGPGGHQGGPHDGKPSYRSQRGDPPPGYVCHRCHVSGHWIQDCPTNGDPKFDKRHRSQNMRCNLPGLVPSVECAVRSVVGVCVSSLSMLSVPAVSVDVWECVCFVYWWPIFLLPMYCRFGCAVFVPFIKLHILKPFLVATPRTLIIHPSPPQLLPPS